MLNTTSIVYHDNLSSYISPTRSHRSKNGNNLKVSTNAAKANYFVSSVDFGLELFVNGLNSCETLNHANSKDLFGWSSIESAEYRSECSSSQKQQQKLADFVGINESLLSSLVSISSLTPQSTTFSRNYQSPSKSFKQSQSNIVSSENCFMSGNSFNATEKPNYSNVMLRSANHTKELKNFKKASFSPSLLSPEFLQRQSISIQQSNEYKLPSFGSYLNEYNNVLFGISSIHSNKVNSNNEIPSNRQSINLNSQTKVLDQKFSPTRLEPLNHMTSSFEKNDESLGDISPCYHWHALHRFRQKKKKGLIGKLRDVVISFTTKTRISIANREDFFWRFGKDEEEALSEFDFLDKIFISTKNLSESSKNEADDSYELFLENIDLKTEKYDLLHPFHCDIDVNSVSNDNEKVFEKELNNLFEQLKISDTKTFGRQSNQNKSDKKSKFDFNSDELQYHFLPRKSNSFESCLSFANLSNDKSSAKVHEKKTIEASHYRKFVPSLYTKNPFSK